MPLHDHEQHKTTTANTSGFDVLLSSLLLPRGMSLSLNEGTQYLVVRWGYFGFRERGDE